MDFVAVVDQAIALLHQRGRVTYRTRKRQFQLDDTALEDLTVELIKGQRLAADEDGEVLVWIGAPPSCPTPAAAAPTPAPLGYTPPYLAEKILTSRRALEGGRVADAMPLCTQVMEQATATGMPVFEKVLCHLFLGEAQVLAGHLEEAHTLTERTLALARERQERGHQAYALLLFGDIAARRDPPESEPAVAHYHQTLALAEELSMRPLQAHCHRSLGMLYAATGQREPARRALPLALEMYRAMDMTFWLPQTGAALAQVDA